MCRRLRKSMAANNDAGTECRASPNHAMLELMRQAQSMDSNEAYKHMCLAQDEIQRLKLEIQQQQEQEMAVPIKNELQSSLDDAACSAQMEIENPREMNEVESAKNETTETSYKVATKQKKDAQMINSNQPPPSLVEEEPKYTTTVEGSWLDQQKGGKCSIEYLPNVKCYQITLTSKSCDSSPSMIPLSKHDLHFTMIPLEEEKNSNSQSTSLISYYEAKLYQLKKDNHSATSSFLPAGMNGGNNKLHLLLSTILPISSRTSQSTIPTARISTDANSISLRIQLQQDMTSLGTDDLLVDNLLEMKKGGSSSSFSTTPSNNTSNASQLNHLCCRFCRNPIINTQKNDDNTNTPTIRAVLPLPSGYWDKISDYLICYEGQAAIDFTSSSTNAILHTALEDDAILVLHTDDLASGGVVCLAGVMGYGEHSSMMSEQHLNNSGGLHHENGGDGRASSQVWKDNFASREIGVGRTNALTCANCCSTLGYVSEQDSNTYRLYKHLLDCEMPPNNNIGFGSPPGAPAQDPFSEKYTCGSFLAREMVRYAESEAVYTFVVGISDENYNWTGVHNKNPHHGACILLRMLGWDTPMAVMGGSANGGRESEEICFRKVVKVIYEVTSDHGGLTHAANSNSDDPLEWSWGGTDFCCLPPTGKSQANPDDDEIAGAAVQTKASSIRIYFSKQEWTDLRDVLARGSDYFSETVKDAIVMTKLGLQRNGGDGEEQFASLSYLTLVS